jgi:hypothetical protein
MATITVTKGYNSPSGFVSGEVITPAKLNSAQSPTVALTAETIVAADIASDAVTTAKILDGNVTTAKIADANVIPAKLSQPLTFRTAQATTSGSAISFADIPSWAKRITVILNQVSTNGTSAVIIQLGDSGGFEETDYIGTGTAITATNTCGVSAFTTGFSAGTGALITSLRSGVVSIVNVEGNTWVASGTLTTLADGSSSASHTQGVKVLSGTLDRVRLTTITGANTFDAGSVNIAYEG